MATLPIVFVPGLMCTGRIYQHQIEHFGQTRPVVLANHWSASSMKEIAASILAAAPERFALVGTSMGGYVSMEIMRQAPERVGQLVLMGTSAKPDSAERSEGRRREVAAVKQVGMRVGTKMSYPHLVHAARHEDHALLNTFIEMAEYLGVGAFERQIDAIISREDSRPTLKRINVPSLMIVGTEDALMPPSEGREIASLVPGCELEEVAHVGHMCMIERPDTVTRLLQTFLD